MKKYRLIAGDNNTYIINHRNAKKAARDFGKDVIIETLSGVPVCGAKWNNGNPYNIVVKQKGENDVY